LEKIFAGIADGRLDEGVVPVENSTGGAVGAVLDLLADPYDLAVRGEIFLPVCQCLLTRPGVKLEQVEKIFSHPQALAQCRKFLQQKLPAAALTDCPSTAAAAVTVAASTLPWAALGPARAAAEHGLQVIIPAVNDYPNNATRFWVVGKEPLPGSQGYNCKTSLILSVEDRPGALYDILRGFALRNLNLTRIESRPAKKNLGDYLFFIDFTGGQGQPQVREALREAAAMAMCLKILGSYPTWNHANTGRSGRKAAGSGETLASLRHNLDLLDAQIVELLVRRTRLVDRVVRLKQNPWDIKDPVRENKILSRVHQLSLADGGDPKLAEEVWKVILKHSVQRQTSLLASNEANNNH